MVNKTITYIKQYFFMLALVATFVGFSAFKFVEKFDEPEDGWYSLSIINEELEDPDIPSNLEIGAKLLTAPPSTGLGCAQDNTGYRCAVHLSFDEDATDMPETLQEADSDPLTVVGSDARNRP